MKKMLSVVLALLLAITLPVSVRAAEAADVLGDWYGSMFGITLTLTLAEDGTYTMVVPTDPDDPSTGTWELKEGKVYMDGDEESPMVFDGNTLTIPGDEPGMEMTFTREPVEAFTPAEPKTDASQEEYQGGWLAQQVSMFGMTLNTLDAGMDFAVVIDGSNASISSTAMGVDEADVPFTFKDGALVIDSETLSALASLAGQEDLAEDIEAGAAVALQLLQDGTMSASLSFAGESVVFYMNPATEEEIAAAKANATPIGDASEGIEEAVEDAEEAVEEAVEEAIEGESQAE